jgi:RNA polymerase sigma-70 factor (ECF subfamily)
VYDPARRRNLGGWLTTVVGRVSLNMLRSRQTRREEPLGVHVPEPIVDRADGVVDGGGVAAQKTQRAS